jgi:hypothetical protein
MAMSCGVAATAGTAKELLAALSGTTGDFTIGEPIRSLWDVPDEVAGVGPVVVGTALGCAYLMDASLRLLTPDAIVEASRRLGRLVVSIGAVTDIGCYWLYAADSGNVLRIYYDEISAQAEPFDEGELLPVEYDNALDDIDGTVLFAALDSCGFQYDFWAHNGAMAKVDFAITRQAPGPLEAEIEAFAAANRPALWSPDGVPIRRDVVRANGLSEQVPPGSHRPDGSTIGYREDAGTTSS